MSSPLHSGSGGSFQLKGVSRSETEITGAVQVNFMNQPKLRIDRVNGRISMSGRSGDYAGQSQA